MTSSFIKRFVCHMPMRIRWNLLRAEKFGALSNIDNNANNTYYTRCAKNNTPVTHHRGSNSNPRYYSGNPLNTVDFLEGNIDRFGGLHIDVEHQLTQKSSLASATVLKGSLLETISRCKSDGRTSVWLEIPARYGHVVPVAADAGFVFHHAEGHKIMMCQWLREGETKVPEYATHQIGVSGFVLDRESERVLMVQDKHRLARWKFPGGYSKLGEDFHETAVREVFEETSIKTEFRSILAFRQQHLMPYSFDRSDIYVVCRLKPTTFDLNICSDELVDAQWIDLKELLAKEEHTHLTREVAKLANHGLRRGFENVDITMRELQSVYKGRTYKLFSRHLPDEDS